MLELEPWKIWLTSGVISLSLLGVASAKTKTGTGFNIDPVGNYTDSTSSPSNATLTMPTDSELARTAYIGTASYRPHASFTAYVGRAFAPRSVASILYRSNETNFTPYSDKVESDPEMETSEVALIASTDTDVSTDIAVDGPQMAETWSATDGQLTVSNIATDGQPAYVWTTILPPVEEVKSVGGTQEVDLTDLSFETVDIATSSFDIASDNISVELDDSKLARASGLQNYYSGRQSGDRYSSMGISHGINGNPLPAAAGFSPATVAMAMAQHSGNIGQASSEIQMQLAAQMLFSASPAGQQAYAQQQYAQQAYVQQHYAQQYYLNERGGQQSAVHQVDTPAARGLDSGDVLEAQRVSGRRVLTVDGVHF